MRALLATGAVVGMALAPVTAVAAPLDGSMPILCALNALMECDGDDCERTTAEETKVPPFVRFDVQKKLLTSVDGTRTSPITEVRRTGGPEHAPGHAEGSDLGGRDQRANRPDVGHDRRRH